MFQPKSSPIKAYPRRVEYTAVDSEETRHGNTRHEDADNLYQSGSDAECAEWLSERLTDCYND